MKLIHWVPAYNELVNANHTAQTHRDNELATLAGHRYGFWASHSCDLVWMRNHTLDRAVHSGIDYLMMQDADVFCSDLEAGAMMPMLRTAEDTGATMVSALVTMRTDPPRGNAWPCRPGQVYTAEKVGTGMVLINVRKIRRWYSDYDGPCFWRTYDSPKGVVQKVGLDVFFSYVLREQDGENAVVVNAQIPTVHVDSTHRHAFDGQLPDLAGIQDAIGAVTEG